MNRFALNTVLFLSMASSIGCATLEVPYEPPGHACGWDPVFGSCDTCGTCGGTCEGHTPASYLGHQLRCTSGCGEIYWGPWINDPPDHCDPCDDCGNWVGERSCHPKLRERVWWTLTGHPGHGKGGKGCSSCGGGGCSSCGEALSDVPYYESDGPLVAPPTPEMRPATPRRSLPEPETPAAARSARGTSPSLPFSIRSTRFAP